MACSIKMDGRSSFLDRAAVQVRLLSSLVDLLAGLDLGGQLSRVEVVIELGNKATGNQACQPRYAPETTIRSRRSRSLKGGVGRLIFLVVCFDSRVGPK